MEAILFVGLQGAGKSTFYKDHFLDTHIRVNLDMLRTRRRERRLVQVCIETRQRFVVDNTNATRAERAFYLSAAKPSGFRVLGYYFQSRVEDCMRRNAARPTGKQVPNQAILGTAARLELPKWDEGFDELFYVSLKEGGGFVIEGWQDEVR